MNKNQITPKIDLSIIIPVYNVEDYIEECLESIAQLKNISYEVILINDGSEDLSIKKADAFSSRIPHLKIINQTNQGAASARNRGLQEASGKYISFVDSDDFIMPIEFEEMALETFKKSIDMTCGNGKILENEKLKPIKEVTKRKTIGLLSGPDYFNYTNKVKEYSGIIWLNFYKSDFLSTNQITFTSGIIHEDEEFLARCLSKASSVIFLNHDFYRYRFREGSVTKSKSHKLLNVKSIPSFQKIIQSLSKIAPASNTQGEKNVLKTTIAKCMIEILRRLHHRKKNGLNDLAWHTLNLENEYKALPFVLRLKVLRFKIKMFL